MDKLPLVSVVMITYNHEAYIEEAIRGVLIQNCDFQIEFIISNDKSTDRTAEVITKILQESKIPEDIIIKVYNHEINKGVSTNFSWALEQATGKYIALCEGDDYWTDSMKLQKQVGFLETNTDYVLCFTNCSTVDQNNAIKNLNFIGYTEDRTFEEKDLMFVAPTLTRVFRLNKKLVISENSIVAQDSLMLIEQMKLGKAKYLNFVSGNYRKHSGGVWSSLDIISIRESKFEIAYYGLKVSNEKSLFFRKSLIELAKLINQNEESFKSKFNKFLINHRIYISLSLKQTVLFKCYLLVVSIPFLSKLNKTRILMRLIKGI
ncbi:glycosyltransferase family 2 protein [Psychroflexus salinarum]|uniref:Glycosyltransferase family 2 protein n=1 Tax=Psychroflexus salinarum TaxID=546024 RepID=A0ABW3GS16_9FLAO